ncbi:MAG: KTSC domain-containing protein [Burkholderiaceae bacterium]
MAIEQRPLRGGRLRSGRYDPATRELDIEFQDREVRKFKGVPLDVWRKLLAAPNPAVFYEDRIEEEYAVTVAERTPQDNEARRQLDDLFGSS